MEEIREFDWIATGTFAVALIALLRPEIEEFLGKWTNKIDFFPSTRIEIGFSDFGPTVGVHGAIRAVGNDQLIRSVKVAIVRQRDSATHCFEWSAFRKINFIQVDKSEIDPASAFLVRRNESKTVNILFHDVNTQEIFRDKALDLRNIFIKYCNDNNIRIDLLNADDWRKVKTQFDTENKSYNLQIYNIIRGSFYWESGYYSINIKISTNRPSKYFDFSYGFQLSAEDSRSLELNIIQLMNAACFQPGHQFQFANARLNER